MCLITETLCSALLSWLPVLVNIEPPAFRCKAAVEGLIEKTALCEDWSLHIYMFSPSCNCLPSRRPLWTDTDFIDIIGQLQNDWKSAAVVNSSLMDDPSIWHLGFNLPWRYWSQINHFRTNEGHCAYCHKNGALQLVSVHQMPNNVSYCQQLSSPQTKLEGGLPHLHLAEDATVQWLMSHAS